MNDKSGIDWDDAFANGAYIENSMNYPVLWAARAAAFRQEAQRLSIHCHRRYDACTRVKDLRSSYARERDCLC